MNSINILGREIPLYSLMIVFGVCLAGAVGIILSRIKKIALFDLLCSGVYVMFGGFIGAKLLFIAVSLPTIIEMEISLISLLYGGFVFYGGMIGGGLALLIYSKRYSEGYELFDIYAVSLPLGHALGRVGCFLAGCCYGIPYDGKFSHVYTESVGLTPLGVPLLPIQLIEAAGLVVLFFVLLTIYLVLGKNQRYLCVRIYLLSYSVMRFILEFFRGDTERGSVWIFSTAQIISVIIFLGVIGYYVYTRAKRRRALRE